MYTYCAISRYFDYCDRPSYTELFQTTFGTWSLIKYHNQNVCVCITHTCSWTDELKDKWSPCNNSWASWQEISENIALIIMSKNKKTHTSKHTIGRQIIVQAKIQFSFQKKLHMKLPSHDTLTESLSEAQCQRLCILGLVQFYSETINLIPPPHTLHDPHTLIFMARLHTTCTGLYIYTWIMGSFSIWGQITRK